MEIIWQGGIGTVFFILFSDILTPIGYVLFALCCAISAGIQFLLLFRVKRRVKWLYSALLLIVTLTADIITRLAYSNKAVQVLALLIAGIGCALLLGAVLATLIWWIISRLKKKA